MAVKWQAWREQLLQIAVDRSWQLLAKYSPEHFKMRARSSMDNYWAATVNNS